MMAILDFATRLAVILEELNLHPNYEASLAGRIIAAHNLSLAEKYSKIPRCKNCFGTNLVEMICHTCNPEKKHLICSDCDCAFAALPEQVGGWMNMISHTSTGVKK
jgi:hypothetical protein